ERYLAFICGAIATDLSNFHLHSQGQSMLRSAIANIATIRNDLLLLDVRAGGPARELGVKLLLALVHNDIGSVGIVQMASDPVHEQEVDGESLSVLPCITLYPGMQGLFEGLAPFPGS